MNNTVIPEMTHPMSKGWDQPGTDQFLVDDTHAILSTATLNALLEYSTSQPSGVYDGKIWKSCYKGEWLLRWFGPCDDPSMCATETRSIILVD